jgi:hypothetical protein
MIITIAKFVTRESVKNYIIITQADLEITNTIISKKAKRKLRVDQAENGSSPQIQEIKSTNVRKGAIQRQKIKFKSL